MVTRAYFNEFVGVLIPAEVYEAPCMDMVTPVDGGSFLCDELSAEELVAILDHLAEYVHQGRIYYEVDGERRRVTYANVGPTYEVAFDCYIPDSTEAVLRARQVLVDAGFEEPLP